MLLFKAPLGFSRLPREQFLKIDLANINGKKYSIRDIVVSCVTIMERVHSGSAQWKKEKVLKAVNDQMPGCGYASSLRQIQAIGRVILKSLTPLTLHIQNRSQENITVFDVKELRKY